MKIFWATLKKCYVKKPEEDPYFYLLEWKDVIEKSGVQEKGLK